MSELKVKWPKDFKNCIFPQCNWIDLGNGTMYRIAAFYTVRLVNGPRDGFFVAIERVGSFLFSLDIAVKFEYVSEKLNLHEPDARNMADWINAQLEHDIEQQGIYFRNYIVEIEPYGHIGEEKEWPITPIIIEGEK